MNKITPTYISDQQEVIVRAKALSVEVGTPITPGFEALVFKASRGIEDIYELTYIRKDGSRFGAVVSVTALRDAQGAINGYLLIGTDNTARKQAEEALLKAGALQSASGAGRSGDQARAERKEGHRLRADGARPRRDEDGGVLQRDHLLRSGAHAAGRLRCGARRHGAQAG